MNLPPPSSRLLLRTCSACLVLSFGSSLNAATLIDGGSIGLGQNPDFGPGTHVSVTTGSAGFSLEGAGSLTPFNGAVYDYAFYDTNTDGAPPSTVGPQGLISGLSDVAGTNNMVDLWTASDPGSDPADLTSVGVRWQDNATFTVDISGLSSGSIYVFNGSWQARSDWLDLSMTGAGQTDVNVTNFATSPAASGVLMNAKRIDFTDAADYDTITFTLQESTEGQSGYFGGVVMTNVTLVPEPSVLLLGGLGGLLLLRRVRPRQIS